MVRRHIARIGTFHREGAYIEGDALERFGVFAYLTAEDDTTCTLADTWYPIVGTFANDPIEGFATVAGPPPGIQYSGPVTSHFEVDWHASIVKAAGSSTVHVGILVNGVEVTSSIMSTFVLMSVLQMSGTAVLELAADDVVTLAVKSSNGTDDLTFKYFTTTICKFFASPNG